MSRTCERKFSVSGAFPGKEKRTSRGLALTVLKIPLLLQFDAIFWFLAPAARSKDEGAKMLPSWIYAIWLGYCRS